MFLHSLWEIVLRQSVAVEPVTIKDLGGARAHIQMLSLSCLVCFILVAQSVTLTLTAHRTLPYDQSVRMTSDVPRQVLDAARLTVG